MSKSDQILRPKLTTLGNAGYDSVILSDHPIAYYPLNEASGKTAMDASGNKNNGTFQGAVELNHRAPYGIKTAIKVGGSGYLASPLLSNIGVFTLEVWANFTSQSGCLFAIASEALLANEAFQAAYFATTGNSYNAIFNTNQSQAGTAGTWGQGFGEKFYHYVWSFALDATNIFYVDNASFGASASTAAIDSGYVTWGAGNVSAWYNSNGDYVYGLLAKAAIYDYILTPEQILSHYNAGRTALRN